ncbi:unnamed protein product [Prorocentrum cordatum]|uniref:DNA/RNA-binding protein Alba-like domain-containing protein n=1 Tax=Prorocentrum cordatum TaxID=2364126 RepID=A0ABN9VKU8_9DINO|nr:unnamed protein product [Polarella glacialis]
MGDEEEKTQTPAPAEPAIVPAPEGAVEMKVTTKKSPGFYIRAVASFLKGVEERPATDGKEKQEAKAAVEYLRVSGLGDAITTASLAASQAMAEGLCEVLKVQTAYPSMEGSGRGCAQIVIDLKTTKK